MSKEAQKHEEVGPIFMTSEQFNGNTGSNNIHAGAEGYGTDWTGRASFSKLIKVGFNLWAVRSEQKFCAAE